LGKPFIFLKSMEPESAGSYEQELKPHAEIFLSGGWEEGAPN